MQAQEQPTRRNPKRPTTKGQTTTMTTMTTTVTTVSDLFPSKYVRATDLQGKAFTLRILNVAVEPLRQMDGSTKPCAICALTTVSGKPLGKRLIVNKTQAKALAHIADSEAFADWQGLVVTLAPSTAPNGKPTIAIRQPGKSR